MIGMPVRTNAAIWREKCMTSWRGTLAAETSSSENRLRSRILTIRKFWRSRSFSAALRLTPSMDDLTCCPSGVTAVYLNTANVGTPPGSSYAEPAQDELQNVDRSHDFSNSGHVIGDQSQ